MKPLLVAYRHDAGAGAGVLREVVGEMGGWRRWWLGGRRGMVGR